MEFDLSLILLALPVAFVLGWMASRMDVRQLRMENRQAPKAYFKGLNFLLNEQQDQAIDAFIEAVQSDPDTRNCISPWAIFFAVVVNTNAPCVCTNTCYRAMT